MVGVTAGAAVGVAVVVVDMVVVDMVVVVVVVVVVVIALDLEATCHGVEDKPYVE
jgi:hypothetical protein